MRHPSTLLLEVFGLQLHPSLPPFHVGFTKDVAIFSGYIPDLGGTTKVMERGVVGRPNSPEVVAFPVSSVLDTLRPWLVIAVGARERALFLAALKLGQTENDVFSLDLLKPWKIDVAESLVPQVDTRFDILPIGEHSGIYVICFDDKHPLTSAPLRNNLAFFLYEPPKMSKSILHGLVDNLSNRH